MVEMHCWITFRDNYYIEEDEEDMDNTIMLGQIDYKISLLSLEDLSIKVKNGEHYIEYSLFSNHMAQDAKELLELFYYVGEVAIGSYGLLYLYDDEDPTKNNSFKVYRLCKGKVIEFDDQLLSPFNPTIEE